MSHSVLLQGLGSPVYVTGGFYPPTAYAASNTDSYKDLFEADMFRPGLFASGIWRGRAGQTTEDGFWEGAFWC